MVILMKNCCRYKFFSSLLILLLTGLFLTACQVASPITTTENFLTDLQKEQYLQATNLLATQDTANNQPFLRDLNDQEKQAWQENTQKALGKVKQFNVQNTVPLSENELKPYGVKEGYQVFYFLESDLKGSQNLNGLIFRVNGAWKLLPPQL
ncbi:hypothetical protein A2160_00455 [Candidatus Beckwithbacteria bacterium RBG_13_42_9]|uniref:DUF4878 domain-containing protein n=1 Tax=Candidatus Beckwithbacteria bacterium RBG_13_42_9 TaxID=1797457 RepID=A0A1F5E3R4_9BACT|nr:MAG: hypothetical protein A2160_00455 [Candidatus Beckwithbacteria bacterium RBG_13_42_9]